MLFDDAQTYMNPEIAKILGIPEAATYFRLLARSVKFTWVGRRRVYSGKDLNDAVQLQNLNAPLVVQNVKTRKDKPPRIRNPQPLNLSQMYTIPQAAKTLDIRTRGLLR